jgi:predicted dehydrogenase
LVPVVGLGLKTPQSRDKFTQFQALLKRNRSVLSYHSPLLSELQYMVQSIRGGTPPTIVTITDALRAVEICEAEEQSVKTGQPVSL